MIRTSRIDVAGSIRIDDSKEVIIRVAQQAVVIPDETLTFIGAFLRDTGDRSLDAGLAGLMRQVPEAEEESIYKVRFFSFGMIVGNGIRRLGPKRGEEVIEIGVESTVSCV